MKRLYGDESHRVRCHDRGQSIGLGIDTAPAGGKRLTNRLLSACTATILLLVAACSDSDDNQGAVPGASVTEASQTTELTDLERDYLVQVSGAWSLFATKSASFRTVFSQAWPTNQRLFDALREAGAGTAWVDSLEAIQQIESPRRFEEDHSRLLARLEEFVRIDAKIGETLDGGDLASFVLLNAELAVVGNMGNLEIDPEICKAIALPAAGNPPCRTIDDLPGGEYGLELELLMLEFHGRLGPRLGVWAPIWRPLADEAEFFQVLEEVEPEVRATIQDALNRLRALEPPAELTADHELLTEHLDTLLEVSARAAVAIQIRDVQAYEKETMTALVTICSTRSALSSDMLLVAHGHFDGGAPCP